MVGVSPPHSFLGAVDPEAAHNIPRTSLLLQGYQPYPLPSDLHLVRDHPDRLTPGELPRILLSTLPSLPSTTCTSGILPSSAILSVTLSPTVITKLAFSSSDLKARPFVSSSLKRFPIGLASLSLRELGSRYSLRGMRRPP